MKTYIVLESKAILTFSKQNSNYLLGLTNRENEECMLEEITLKQMGELVKMINIMVKQEEE
ncbi:MAG: hypothetical protein DRQ46_00375 [Gammaproteobacteria bacterium]|nr:MAG: hypothetical protein DRQ46_00375 [Gammaproteobacteria bacterium]